MYAFICSLKNSMSDVLYIFDKFRISRLNCHVCDINKPPVTKFNLTLFNLFLGAMMMPSRVLSYLQMGHFLMLVMALGWAFSTFFFQALCSTIGPQGDWGQFSWSDIFSSCCKKTSNKEQSKEERKLLRTECESGENCLEMNSTSENGVVFNSMKTTAV